MNSKFYVSLEAEELLKEKGYPFVWGYDSIHPRKVTKAEAIDWLESKGIIVELSYDDRPHKDFLHWEYFVYVNDKDGWLEAVVCSWEENNYYKTRLEAEEAAIIKALELL